MRVPRYDPLADCTWSFMYNISFLLCFPLSMPSVSHALIMHSAEADGFRLIGRFRRNCFLWSCAVFTKPGLFYGSSQLRLTQPVFICTMEIRIQATNFHKFVDTEPSQPVQDYKEGNGGKTRPPTNEDKSVELGGQKRIASDGLP